MVGFASLFGGGRLADIGAMAAGCDLLWDVELNGVIAAIGSQLAGKTYVCCVTEMDWAKVDVPDILWASPPCPNFSVAKHGRSETDSDRVIAESVVDAITILKPKVFVLENVEGYRRSDSFQSIVNALYGLGYWCEWSVLNSADFGVPQTRKRLILRAVKDGFVPALPEPVEWVGWFRSIEDLIPTLPDTKFTQRQIEAIPEYEDLILVEGSGNRSESFTVRRYREPSFTIRASASKKASKAKLEQGRVVKITARALARFQSVPDWYVLPDNNFSLASRIIGNGVPCKMAQAIVDSVMP